MLVAKAVAAADVDAALITPVVEIVIPQTEKVPDVGTDEKVIDAIEEAVAAYLPEPSPSCGTPQVGVVPNALEYAL
jgi:hypothetical protein